MFTLKQTLILLFVMLNVQCQVQKPEAKLRLAPLSHVINYIMPSHEPLNQTQFITPSRPHKQQVPTNEPQLRCAPPNQQYQPTIVSNSSIIKSSSISQFNKCFCKQENAHIPKPRNAFIIFRQQHHQSVLDESTISINNLDISRELGKRWRNLSQSEKQYWSKVAEDEKKKHYERYPEYRYIPKRFRKKVKCSNCQIRAQIKKAEALRILNSHEQDNEPKTSFQLKESQTIVSFGSISGTSTLVTNLDKVYNSVSHQEHTIDQSLWGTSSQSQNYYSPKQCFQQNNQLTYDVPTAQVQQEPSTVNQGTQNSLTKNDQSPRNSEKERIRVGSIASFLN